MPHRPHGEQALYCLQPTTTQLLHFEAVPAVPRKAGLALPSILFDEKDGHAELELRNDLLDSGVDICSVDVPPLFSENFDYQDLRRDFVTGILTSDLLESKIFVHVAPSSPHATTGGSADAQSLSAWSPRPGRGWGYAARVRDTKSYDAISRDILARWLLPLGPAANMPGSGTLTSPRAGTSADAEKAPRTWSNRYTLKAGLRYTGEDVILSRSCQIGTGTLIGPGSRIGERAVIVRSVLGPGCVIEDDAQISDSYIWAGARIGPRAVVQKSILGESVTLLQGARVQTGTLVAGGCTIGRDAVIPPMSRIAKMSYADAKIAEEEEDGDDEFQTSFATSSSHSTTAGASTSAGSSDLGEGGVGYLWPARGQEPDEEDDEYEDEDDIIEAPQNVAMLHLGVDLDKTLQLDDDIDDLSSIDGDSDIEDEDDGASLVSSATSAAMGGASGKASAAGSRAHSKAPSGAAGAGADGAGMDESLTLSGTGASAGEKAAAHQRLLDFQDEALASLTRAFAEQHTVSNISIELKTLRMATNVPQKEVCAIVVAFVLSQLDASKPKELVQTMDKWGPLIAGVAADDEIEALSVMQVRRGSG